MFSIYHISTLGEFLKTFIRANWSYKSVVLLYFLIFAPGMLVIVMGINARIGLSAINHFLSNVLFVLLFLFGQRYVRTRMRWWDFLIVVGIGWFCFWSPKIYPETEIAVLEFGPYLVFGCLPFYLVGAMVNIVEDDNIFSNMGRAGLIANTIVCIISLIGLTNTFNAGEESMALSYNTLPSAILVLRNEIRNHNRSNFLYSLWAILLLLSLGTRGPILAIVLFVGGYLFLFKNYSRPFISRVCIILSLAIIYLLLEPIVKILSAISGLLGFGTRVYDKILNSDMTNTDTRDWIFDTVLNYIESDSGNIGNGLFYDRVIMGMDQSSYTHNIVLEIWLNFGVYIGSCILIMIIAMLIINMLKTKGTDACSLLFAFFCFCIVQLFFSSSYLCSRLFWIFIGLMVTTLRTPKGQF